MQLNFIFRTKVHKRIEFVFYYYYIFLTEETSRYNYNVVLITRKQVNVILIQKYVK